MKKKLYVLIDNSLDPVYGCVQGGHAVAQFLIDHPLRQWNNDYLIYLYADISKWENELEEKQMVFSTFREPDLGNIATAIAVEHNGKLFKHLKLIGIESNKTV